jgi:DNA-binding CsgD family transcriptional regulator
MSIAELARPEAELTGSLTRRERVVLSHLSEDITLEQIATQLFVSRNTVKSQVRSLYRKLGVSTRAEALDWARGAGLR